MRSQSTPLISVVLALAGIFYTLTSLALLFAPVWFFQHIGGYPPYNRHYEGDLGTFLLPLGGALLYAARRPSHHLTLIWVAALGSLLHALNHVYEAIQLASSTQWLGTVAPLTVTAFALLMVALRLTTSARLQPSQQV